mgnify:CR=1 FL=1
MKKVLLMFSFMALIVGYMPVEAQEQFSSDQDSFEQQKRMGGKSRRGPQGRMGKQSGKKGRGGNLQQIQNQLVTLLVAKGAKFEVDPTSNGVTIEITSDDELVASKINKVGKMLKLLKEIEEDDKKLKEKRMAERKNKLQESKQ